MLAFGSSIDRSLWTLSGTEPGNMQICIVLIILPTGVTLSILDGQAATATSVLDEWVFSYFRVAEQICFDQGTQF